MIDIYNIFKQDIAVVTQRNLVHSTHFKHKLICPECKGDCVTLHRDAARYDSEYEKETCVNCGGTGIVQVKVEVKRVI